MSQYQGQALRSSFQDRAQSIAEAVWVGARLAERSEASRSVSRGRLRCRGHRCRWAYGSHSRHTALKHPAADRHSPVGCKQDDCALFVWHPKRQHLRHEGTDLAGWEVDDGDDQPADQILAAESIGELR